MSGPTKIGWCDVTWNPIRGCSQMSEGCRNCYAERRAVRFSGEGLPFHGFAKQVAPRDDLSRVGFRRAGWTGRVELIKAKLVEPLHWRKPRRIFVNSMSDLFHETLSGEAILGVFGAMAACPQHTFIVLAKRSGRMRRWFEWYLGAHNPIRFRHRDMIEHAAVVVGPDGPESDALFRAANRVAGRNDWPLRNVQLVVSAEDQTTANVRIGDLLQTPAAVRGVSVEPMLGPVLIPRRWLGQGSECPECGYAAHVDEDGLCASCGADCMFHGLDWVVCGSETGPDARPFNLEWARELRHQCLLSGVPFWLKQTGTVAERDRVLDGRTWEERP
jgi:protein gp37